ncbi:MAG TPA: diguanylate cyclase, partial [Solirubrobacteraceae bacterium]|nr:diguanylate cyclase [Solirubrobacteraceae bacterium]
MGQEPPDAKPSLTSSGNHFSCSMTAVLLAEVVDRAGEQAVGELLALAGSTRSAAYLQDITNWISYDEAVALWRAGARVTQNPRLPELVGQRAAERLSASPVATLLRSLGSPGNLYREISTGATKFSTVIRIEPVETGPGFAELVAIPVGGFPRSAEHCAWTTGMLSGAPILFGLPRASVEHDRCAALGAPDCRYLITWSEAAAGSSGSGEQLIALRHQLEGMQERLHSMFATASDLIAGDDIGDVLARITDRAAMEVRAPRFLLSVRMEPGGQIQCHHRGFAEDEVARLAEQILEPHPSEQPKSWLVVSVRSERRDYGRLLAAFEADERFFPQERELLEVYARYAATALDGAAALMEANRRYHQSSALLKLARALATAGTTGEVANRLADAVPLVVDCDRVGVYLWDPARGELVRRAIATPDGTVPEEHEDEWSWAPQPGDALERLLNDPRQDPIFTDAVTGDPAIREGLRRRGESAVLVVPLATEDSLLGALAVSVRERPERLRANPDLLDRLSGVAAQATTALQNGRLVDQITHQAMHDQLTGLANRLQFAEKLRKAVNRARQREEMVTMFYIDLNDFKPVNDAYGHEVGDKLLSALGKRLNSCTRASDTVARLGGDEFAVLIGSQTSPPDSDLLAIR